MGLFDSLTIDSRIIPLNKKEKSILPKNSGWQTKNLGKLMQEYYINANGNIWLTRHKHVKLPKTEIKRLETELALAKESKNKRKASFLKWDLQYPYKSEISHYELVDFHGYIKVISSEEMLTSEFLLKYNDGELIKIERLTKKNNPFYIW